MASIRRAVFVFLLILPTLAFAQADQEVVSVVDAPDPVVPGQTMSYTVTVTNHGPAPAVNGGFNTSFPGEVTYQNTVAPAGFTCSTFGSALSCVNPAFAPGTVVFTVNVMVASHLINFPDGSFSTTFSPSGTTIDPNNGNNNKTATTTYNTPQIDVALTASDSPDPVTPNQNITYTVQITNNGPDPATNVIFNMPHNGGSATFQSMITPAGWTCTGVPAAGGIANFSCTKPSLAAGVPDTFTIVVKADRNTIGINDAVINQAFTAFGTGDDTNDGNSSETESTTYQAPDANLTIAVTDSPDPVTPDNNVTFTAVINNLGPDTATDVNFNVFNNGSLRYQSITIPAGWSCPSQPAVGGNPAFTCTNPSFASGASSTFIVVLSANDEIIGINDTTVQTAFTVASSTVADPTPGNNTETESTAYITPDADVQITATDSPDPVNPDGDITYTVTVTNAGPDAAPNAILNVPMNNTLRFQSITVPAGWSCTPPAVGAGTSFSCTNPSLASGVSSIFTIVLRANDEQFGINDQTIVQNFNANSAVTDPVGGNNSVNVSTSYVAPDADIQITATDSPDPVNPDGDITYTVTVTNAGPDAAPNAILNVPMNNTLRFQSISVPSGWTCTPPAVGAGTSFSCTNPSLASGVSSIFTIVLRANDEQFGINDQTIVQNFNANSAVSDPVGGNNSVNVSTSYVTPDADLAITASDSPDPVVNGGTLTFTVGATNNGPMTATSPQVTLAPHPSLTFQSVAAPAGWTCTTPAVDAAGVTTCTKASMISGETASFTLVTKLVTAGSGGTINSVFTISSPVQDPVPANNSVEIFTNWIGQSADLAITKNTLSSAAAQGGTITYTIFTANNGPNDAFNVTVTDVLPGSLLFQSITAPAGWICATPAVGTNGTVACTIATFANGATASFTLVTTVAPNATGTISNSASIGSTTATDPTPGDASRTSETVTIAGNADLSIVKNTTGGNVSRGDTIQYVLSITNAGPDPAASVTVTDTLPSSLLFQSINAPGWTCSTPAVGATGTITCTRPSLPLGPSSITLEVTVSPTATGNISNSAAISHSGPDSNGGNSTSTSAPAVVVTAVDLTVSKSTATTSVTLGQVYAYTIDVTNNGPDLATNVSMTDTLPATLLFQSITTPAGFTCNTPAVGSTGTITCTAASLASATTATFTLTVRVANGATGTITNTANVTSSEDSGTSTTPPIPVTQPSADVTISKTTTATNVVPNQTFAYTIAVTNNGPDAATNVVMTDTLPASLLFQSISAPAGFSCATPAVGATGTITCTAATMAAGTANFTLTVRVAPNATGTISNTASVDSNEDDATSSTGPEVFVTGGPASEAEIPTLSEWALIALAMMLGIFAVARMRFV